jgi:SAM-dependent methyltransferase
MKNLAASYDVYFRTGHYALRYPKPNPNMVRLITQNTRPAGVALDFGCGTGRYIPCLLANGMRVIAYDISHAALQGVKTSYPEAVRTGRVQPIMGDMEDLEAAVAPATLDVALLAFGVLGHIRGDQNRLTALHRVRALLRPGGRLIVTVPNANRRFRHEQIACRPAVAAGTLEPGDILYQRHSASGPIDMYYHLFRKSNFLDLLGRAGFHILRYQAESILPEKSVVTFRGMPLFDRALMSLVPDAWAYGHAAVATVADASPC